MAILVKVKMPGGPVFFVQKRVGRHGRLFDCHKFRTMTVKHNGSTVSVAGDSREAQDIAVEYNDKVIYPDKVRLNCYYYRNYSFMIFYAELPNMDAGGPVHDGEVAADESCFVETARFRVCPRDGQYGIQEPLGAWHSVVVHEPSTILEAKDGAYGK